MAERGIDAPWPIAGLPEALHVDNGADFRSRAFERACRNHGIQIRWRPVGEPHFGGHIERLIGTTMGAVHMLPGSTFSNPADRGDYQSASAARMTLRELEQWIAWEIAGNYHQRVHSALNRPPIAVWREHEDKVNLRLPVDRLQFWVSFLPEDERNLRRDGIHFCNIRYWSDALAADVGQSKEKLLIKYDPRDLSRIFVRRPSGSFVEARYRDLGWPAITLAEQRAVMRLLRAQGRREVDEALLFKTALRQREIVDAARRQTVATRRSRGTAAATGGAGEPGWQSEGDRLAQTVEGRRGDRREGVSDDLSHLTPAAAELLQAPNDQRIRAILGERWVQYARAGQVLRILDLLLEHPRTTRMPSIAVYGDSGMGKTMIMQRFRDRTPAALRQPGRDRAHASPRPATCRQARRAAPLCADPDGAGRAAEPEGGGCRTRAGRNSPHARHGRPGPPARRGAQYPRRHLPGAAHRPQHAALH